MMSYLKKQPHVVVAAAASLISIASWAVFFSLGFTTIYNDAMSHLNIARLVVDNIQPGMSQLGSVWLPMSHVLSLPFIWNDFLWHTGLAGSLVSMAAFVLSAVGIYKIIELLSGSVRGGMVGALAFCLSLNMLYLQATPLTEPLYIVLFVFTCLYLIKYLRYQEPKALVALGMIGAVGILTRYDAWFVAGIVGLIIIANEWFFRKQKAQVVFGNTLLYAFPIIFGVILWLGWNLLIFGDPLYSFIGPYSARAQQAAIEATSGLITKHHLGVSSWAYLLSVAQNVGVIVLTIGTVGWLVYMVMGKYVGARVRLLAAAGMASVIVFNILALYLGFSILNLPELNWNPSGTLAGELFNVRYGILALPFAAVGVGLLVAHIKKYRTVVVGAAIAALVGQGVLTFAAGVITVADGRIGSSAFVNDDIAQAIKNSVKPGEKVIMSTSSYNAVAFRSGLPLKEFIHEGVSRQWNGAISQPENYGKWIVLANNDIGEPVHEALMKKQRGAFLALYEKVYTGTYASLYKLK